MAILKDLIVHGSSRFLNKIYANELETSAFEADSAVIKKLKADDATVVGLLDVQGQLHTNTWTNSNIATIDGCFYITPTLSSDSGKISFSSTSVASLTGTYAAVTSLYIGDSSSGSTVQWTSGSNVLLTGEVEVNGQWLPLGTLLGTLSANAATDSIGLSGLTDNRHNISSIITDIRNAVGNTSLNYRNLKISLYQRKDGTDSKPLGIYMTAMGANGKTFIDIYGGVNATTTAGSSGGFADPNLRIGNLSGLGAVEGTTPTGWGIYTTNGYFKGVIVSSAGKIGNFTINSALYSNNHSAWNSNVSGIYINNDGISGGAGGKWWLWNDGSAKIGAMTLSAAGVLTVPAANVSGELTAATINGSKITANTITADQIAAGAIKTDELDANAVTSAKIKAGEVKATNIASSAVTADKLDATTINASNKLTVGALTTTDQNNILNSNIQIGGRNLFRYSHPNNTYWWNQNSSNATVNKDKITITQSGEFFQRYNSLLYSDEQIIPAGTQLTLSCYFYENTIADGNHQIYYADQVIRNGARTTAWLYQKVPINYTGLWSVTFTTTEDISGLYIEYDTRNMTSGKWVCGPCKLEIGNKATTWSPAPEDIDVHKYITDIDSNKGITIKPTDTSGNDYLQINSSAISMYKGNTKIFNVDSNGYITIGKVGSNNRRNIYITDSVIQIRNNASILAEYGSDIILGEVGTNKKNIYISPQTGLDIRNDTTSLANFDNTIRIGKIVYDRPYATVDNNGINILISRGPITNKLISLGALYGSNANENMGHSIDENFTYTLLYEPTAGSTISLALVYHTVNPSPTIINCFTQGVATSRTSTTAPSVILDYRNINGTNYPCGYLDYDGDRTFTYVANNPIYYEEPVEDPAEEEEEYVEVAVSWTSFLTPTVFYSTGDTISGGYITNGTRTYNTPIGGNSLTNGTELIASSRDQIVVGRYNEADDGDENAIIVGDGNSEQRHNSFTVGRGGNVFVAGNLDVVGNIVQNGTAVSLYGHTHNASAITRGILPITRGGSGNSRTYSTTTVSNVCTAASGWSVTQAQYSSWGKVATIHLNVKKNGTAASSGYQTICTLQAGKRPMFSSPALKGWHDGAIVNTDGTIQFSDSVAANENVQIRATYVLA